MTVSDITQPREHPNPLGTSVTSELFQLLRDGRPRTRTELATHLDEKKIGNRMLFGGNLVRQPAFVQLRRDDPNALRVSGTLPGADHIMENTLFLGTYPGLTRQMIDYMIEVIRSFVAGRIAGIPAGSPSLRED